MCKTSSPKFWDTIGPNARAISVPVAITLLLCGGGSSGRQSAAAHYQQQARRVGCIAARETRAYIERDQALSDHPDDRSRSLEQVEQLERIAGYADVTRLAEIQQSWMSVAPVFRAYVLADADLDPGRRDALLAMANSFDQLNRTERGRQLAWFREQNMRHRFEPN